MASARGVRHFLKQQRPKLALLFLLIGIVVVADVFVSDWPREREVHYLLEGTLRAAEGARIDYLDEGEVVSALELHFPQGAPQTVVHNPTLASGRYDVTIDLTLPGGRVTRHRRVLEVPYEGVMRFRLRPEPVQ